MSRTHGLALFRTLYIINVRVSKYFVTFETTIWYLWELRLSRECPVREASPSDASGVVSRYTRSRFYLIRAFAIFTSL